MSFILDALKKAEAERQRQSGPTLLEVRVSSPRRRFPLWTLVLGLLLVINMILLLLFALHKPAAPLGAGATAAVARTSGPAPAPAPSAASSTTASSAPASAPLAGATAADTGAAALAGSTAPAQPSAFVSAPASAPGADAAANPADDQPAIAARGERRSADADTASINPMDLPSLAELGADMPELRLDLHVYAEHRADRYALINMHKVHEGDALPEGPRVLQIFRDGVALSYRGTEFMLRPQ
jgi:general secretion pathway protein B